MQAAAAAVRQEAAAAELALEAELEALREANTAANAQLREAILARSAMLRMLTHYPPCFDLHVIRSSAALHAQGPGGGSHGWRQQGAG